MKEKIVLRDVYDALRFFNHKVAQLLLLLDKI